MQKKEQEQEDLVNLVLLGGAVALGLLLGLTGTSKAPDLSPSPTTL